MQLTPREADKLLIYVAADVARRRRARGLKLNVPEATALITEAMLEGARDGRSVSEVMALARGILGRDDVMEHVPELITADEAGYVALAVKLGTDPAYRRQLHDRILAAMAQPPRFINPPAYAQELGELLASLVAGKKRPVETLALA